MIARMRALPEGFAAYAWAPSTEALAARVSLRPAQIVRFDGNVPARPPASATPAAVASALAVISSYAHGGYPRLVEAIARYAGVGPENVVLGAGADDLILLCARAFAGPGDSVAVAHEPTYPLFRVAAGLAGAAVNGSTPPAVTFCCRPNNPSGALVPLPDERPLVVDEAYYEYAGETAAGLLDDGVVVLRTFSKAFGLAGARVGYALAAGETADELNRRQGPAPVSTLSVALALAALEADPPNVVPILDERERLSSELARLGFRPLPSRANFVAVPIDAPADVTERLLHRGIAVRPYRDGIRITVRNRTDDDRLLEAIRNI
jgi:histidinol-phosphate aminotransferase